MYQHISVLKQEALDGLNLKENGIYVDATLGGGGHASEILKRIPNGHLYAFDQDEYAIEYAKERLEQIGSNFTLIKSNFINLKEELNKLNVTKIDGILYDLGVSSFQLDIPERGFSYNYDAPLDMRMDETKEFSAYDIVNNYSFHDIQNILYKYGEEEYAKNIARGIEKYRETKKIETTFELVDIIKKSLPMKYLNKKGHPAKKTFQALRIAVNNELDVFEKSLYQAIDLLDTGGRIVVISFHSLEDRICKTIFKDKSTIYIPKGLPIISNEIPPLKLVSKKIITASDEELEINNRAHSAKMRIAEKN